MPLGGGFSIAAQCDLALLDQIGAWLSLPNCPLGAITPGAMLRPAMAYRPMCRVFRLQVPMRLRRRLSFWLQGSSPRAVTALMLNRRLPKASSLKLRDKVILEHGRPNCHQSRRLDCSDRAAWLAKPSLSQGQTRPYHGTALALGQMASSGARRGDKGPRRLHGKAGGGRAANSGGTHCSSAKDVGDDGRGYGCGAAGACRRVSIAER